MMNPCSFSPIKRGQGEEVGGEVWGQGGEVRGEVGARFDWARGHGTDAAAVGRKLVVRGRLRRHRNQGLPRSRTSRLFKASVPLQLYHLIWGVFDQDWSTILFGVCLIEIGQLLTIGVMTLIQ
eukprot:1145868-Pelagomonas_calceolata.AAC.1